MNIVCLSICWQLYVKTTRQIFTIMLPQMYLWTYKNWFNFGSHPPPDSGIFEGLFSIARRDFLRNLAYISRESDQIFMKFPVKCWKQSGTGVRIQTIILFGGSMRSLLFVSFKVY